MQLEVNIIINFAYYLILAISFSLYYFTNKAFNMMNAFMIVFSSYLIYLKIPLFFSITFAIIISVLIEKWILMFFKDPNKNLKILISSLGLYTIFQNIISIYFGDDTKTINTGEIAVGHEVFGAHITTIQIIAIIVASLVFMGMYFLYNYTSLGKQIRAVSENSELSGIYGISSNKIILIVTAISSGLAAIAGILYAYDTNLTPTMGFNLLLYGIVAMIIGGVGSFRGLLFGSFLLATAQNLVAYYFDTNWMDASTYIILIVFLLWKPLGFSGKKLKKVEI